MENLSKDEARQQFLCILKSLPCGNSTFFSVLKIDDPIGLLPRRIILGINKRGVHFFRPVPKEYLHFGEFRDIMQFGSSDTAVIFKMRVAGGLHIFQFETKQGEEICVALRAHINDVMFCRYSKAQSVANGSLPGKSSQPLSSSSSESYKKHIEELSKALEESQKHVEKVRVLEKNFQEEQRTLKAHVLELEKKLESITWELSTAQSTIVSKNKELVTLQSNLRELDELREMKEDIDRKDKQTAEILKRQGEQIIDLQTLYKEEQVLRKRYFNTIEDMKGKIGVFCRVRPLTEKEIVDREKAVVRSLDEFTVEHLWKDDKLKQQSYDHVFDDATSQDEVFEDTKYLVESAIDGYNVCIFAYGQTGSGKTFTIYGTDTNPGLTPRAIGELFKITKRESHKYSFSLKVYMVKLYQDTLVDLLLLKNAKKTQT